MFVHWNDKDLESITSLVLVNGGDHYKVAKCEGRLKDNKATRVILPFSKLNMDLRYAIVNEAKRCGVFAKALGIFDAITIT